MMSAEAAQREAQVLVAKEPRNWQARATLGLACLRLGPKPGSARRNSGAASNGRRAAGRARGARSDSRRERI